MLTLVYNGNDEYLAIQKILQKLKVIEGNNWKVGRKVIESKGKLVIKTRN